MISMIWAKDIHGICYISDNETFRLPVCMPVFTFSISVSACIADISNSCAQCMHSFLNTLYYQCMQKQKMTLKVNHSFAKHSTLDSKVKK